ncbi:unnamed protein product [Tilletia controversa]|uniref:Thioredoxin domain-containing protein n=3 Tax=Tilletia TaxID=13289 RepID=A0A8X7SZN1_9BASI|nr:hypothetical protein CF336_g5598 [Tilletia laevis]KAE8192994.1 hypothetical protein CF328_g5187 [Tilletia controversa]KAE8264521.1 hypothetical protein A4X03_0g880 [Tilletia caries]KAE8196501.1 hypothetical protein CF335_g4845 [Tilletia laevis]KAE8253271.1 hypothetical protein A4X06_0g1572 [Tilletia controversa]
MSSGIEYHPTSGASSSRSANSGAETSEHRGIIDSLQDARAAEKRELRNAAGSGPLSRDREDVDDVDALGEEDEDDDEALFEQLDQELESGSGAFDLAGFRERRMDQLKQDLATMKEMRETNHGKYTEFTNEKELLQTTVKERFVVVHFFSPEFQRCQIMDKHLAEIAPHHFRTLFVRANVHNVPFLVNKLKVKVLPCVVLFVDSVAKDRVIGFEDLGNTDNFTSAMLEWRLSHAGVISSRSSAGAQKSILGISSSSADDDYDYDS